ncbi:MAG: hypothetical protein B6229_08625 [Spirochaetaceae bacterium 4572_7]|nr:MAG: hypothetical protein B6229_08625 [Spirochaetaceae bacterium 4572_7]
MDRKLLRGESIYSVYIRSHSVNGDIQGVINDLERIKSLGITILWILPHYEIGVKARKGGEGSPYSISDYYSVNPDLGGLNDFKELIDKCHQLDIKFLIDIVFNHTSCDSALLEEHPNWFVKTADGEHIGKVPHWSDVYDLDFSNRELWNYFIDVLKYWADLGVDGFRCDVASIIPLAFWEMAKDTINSSHRDLIWLAESVEKEFVSFIRHNGYQCHSDSELYQVFDILYDYDIQNYLYGYINGEIKFEEFVKELRNQEVVYPEDYLKLRFLENHDSKLRIAKLIPDIFKLKNWKAFSMFEKGVPLIYAGEEYKLDHIPNLFEKDPIDWSLGDSDYFKFVKKLLNIDHMYIVTNGIYTINPLAKDCVHLRYRYNGETLHGIFNFGEKNRHIQVEVLEGEYFNMIDGEIFYIKSDHLDLSKTPIIFKSVP